MSQENVEIVRRAFEAFNGTGLDALLEHFHPDIEYDLTTAIGPFAGMYYGRAAVRSFLEDYFESWEYVRMEPEGFIEVGEDHVVVPLRLRMRGVGSGVAVEAQTTNVWTVRNGLAVRIAVHNDKPRLSGRLTSPGKTVTPTPRDESPTLGRRSKMTGPCAKPCSMMLTALFLALIEAGRISNLRGL